MTDEPGRQEKELEFKRSEVIKDLEPEKEESDAVTGGALDPYVSTTGQKSGQR